VAREELLARTFVDLASIGTGDVDPVKIERLVVARCVELFDAPGAGIILRESTDHLRVAASSSTEMHGVEQFELRSGQGPCMESYRTGSPITETDLIRARHRWPRFGPVATAAGFRSAHAVPIDIHGHIIGALNLFRTKIGALPETEALAARALAQATAITILRRESETVDAGHLPVPSADQIVLEQAKGIVAGLADVTVDEALTRIHRYARHHDLTVNEVCHDVVGGTLHLVTFQEISHRRLASKPQPRHPPS
jgi:hypothetical protein